MTSQQTPSRPDLRAALLDQTPALIFDGHEYQSSSPPLATPKGVVGTGNQALDAKNASIAAAHQAAQIMQQRAANQAQQHQYKQPFLMPIYHQSIDGSYQTSISTESALQLHGDAFPMVRSHTAPPGRLSPYDDNAQDALRRSHSPQPGHFAYPLPPQVELQDNKGKRRKLQHDAMTSVIQNATLPSTAGQPPQAHRYLSLSYASYPTLSADHLSVAAQNISRSVSPVDMGMHQNQVVAPLPALPPSNEWMARSRSESKLSAASSPYAASEAGSDNGSSHGSEYVPDNGGGASSPLSSVSSMRQTDSLNDPSPVPHILPAVATIKSGRRKPLGRHSESSDPDFSVRESTHIPMKLPPPARDRSAKPAFSYAALIGQAILSSERKKLSLNDIYVFIMAHYPYYKKQDAGWQNSIRHNLSLNQCFIKTARDQDNPGKGSLWTVVSGCEGQFEGGGFVKKGNAGAPKRVKKNDNGAAIAAAAAAASAVHQASSGFQRASQSFDDEEEVAPPPVRKTKRKASQAQPEADYNEDDVAIPPLPPVVKVENTRRSRKTSQPGASIFESPDLQSNGWESSKAQMNSRTIYSPGTIGLDSPKQQQQPIFAVGPQSSHLDEAPLHITAEMLSSPDSKTIAQSAPDTFLPPVHISTSPSSKHAAVFQYESSSAYFSSHFGNSLNKSPTSSMRRGSFGKLPGSPLKQFQRAGSSPPSVSSKRRRRGASADSDFSDMDSDADGGDITRPTSALPELQTPSRALNKSPSRAVNDSPIIGLFSSSSKALQFVQNEHGTPSRRPFHHGLSSPGKNILASPGQIFSTDAFSDPYDFSGMVEHELDRFGESVQSHHSSKSSNILSTPKIFDTPRFLHSSSTYSPW